MLKISTHMHLHLNSRVNDRSHRKHLAMRLAFALVLLSVAIISAEGTEEQLKEISSNELLAKIELGLPVEYDDVLIRGDLNISQLNLPTTTTSREAIQGLHRDDSENLYVFSPRLNFLKFPSKFI
jgi:hypothetical protein